MSGKDETVTELSEPCGRTSYTCPGELYSIPRSIHLARLAAFYPKCRECEHRSDAGYVFPREMDEHRSTERRLVRDSLLTDENVRGVYLNELDRNRALNWGEAVAAYLWDKQPMIARRESNEGVQIVSDTESIKSTAGSKGPKVIVGFDERPSSPDIVSGLVLGLRRMGCPVIDLGQTALPALAFHVNSQDAFAGVFVTGSGCDASRTGFDLVARFAHPFPYEGLLSLENSVKAGIGRQSRLIGDHQPLQGQMDYEASLEPRFHAIRPLRIVCGTSTRMLPRVLDRLFARLPCELTHLPLPMRQRNLFDVRDIDLQRVATAVVEGQKHFGVIIDEDGRHTAFVTDRGRLVTAREVARLLIEFMQREHHAAKFSVATSWLPDVQKWLVGRDASAIDGGESPANLVRLLVEHDAALALSADGRIWFGHAYPACDALLVLAHVMQALSLSDAPFSEVVTRLAGDTKE